MTLAPGAMEKLDQSMIAFVEDWFTERALAPNVATAACPARTAPPVGRVVACGPAKAGASGASMQPNSSTLRSASGFFVIPRAFLMRSQPFTTPECVLRIVGYGLPKVLERLPGHSMNRLLQSCPRRSFQRGVSRPKA